MHRVRFATTARFGVALSSVVLLSVTAAPALAHRRGHDRDRRSEGPLTLAAAGDIACTPGELGVPPNGTANGPDNCVQSATASLIEDLNPDVVAAPGDIQYQFGSLTEFMGSFDRSWGSFKSKIYPAPGNHEWYDLPVNGAGYFDYFNGIGTLSGPAGVRGEGYYSVDLNRRWHLIALNSNCTSDNPRILMPVPCYNGSAQEQWLRADLRAHRGMCIIAEWHHPYFTSGPNQGGPNDLATQTFWHDLYQAGATLILNGHDHGYERFARQTDTGQPDPAHGVRQFVVGTGGKSLFGPGPKMAANSEVYNVTTYGVTLFTLRSHTYSWQFYRAPIGGNGTLADAGSGRCNTQPEE
jgi:acid phosphatase type 7